MQLFLSQRRQNFIYKPSSSSVHSSIDKKADVAVRAVCANCSTEIAPKIEYENLFARSSTSTKRACMLVLQEAVRILCLSESVHVHSKATQEQMTSFTTATCDIVDIKGKMSHLALETRALSGITFLIGFTKRNACNSTYSISFFNDG